MFKIDILLSIIKLSAWFVKMSTNKYPNIPEMNKCLKLYIDSPNDIIMKRKIFIIFIIFQKKL